jgi:hypothetical protein
MLEQVWVRSVRPGKGTMFMISGFANYNGGLRFYEVFKLHVAKGGKVVAYFSGSTSQRLTSRQVVEAMLECGAKVKIINRKRLVHAKFYGARTDDGEFLIVTSGNFTGPGMSGNIEASILLYPKSAESAGFSWSEAIAKLEKQKWEFYEPTLTNPKAPAWKLLYDEFAGDVKLEETDEVTMVLTLSHADTARINAESGTSAGKGTQYFWLSKDCYDFFPPLIIRNSRGIKATYSCLINLRYVDLDESVSKCRVTFEAENNFDFRFGTGRLRSTGLVKKGDMAAISRVDEDRYELRLFKRDSSEFKKLTPYAVNFIGHEGKRYGYIPNEEFEDLLTLKLG